MCSSFELAIVAAFLAETRENVEPEVMLMHLSLERFVMEEALKSCGARVFAMGLPFADTLAIHVILPADVALHSAEQQIYEALEAIAEWCKEFYAGFVLHIECTISQRATQFTFPRSVLRN